MPGPITVHAHVGLVAGTQNRPAFTRAENIENALVQYTVRRHVDSYRSA